jgi:hypothetical protein
MDHKPIGIFERHKAAGAWLIPAEVRHLVKERGILQRNRERCPMGLRDAAIEDRRISELGPPLRQLFPESPTAAIWFGPLFGRTGHRTHAGGIGHGAVLHENKVTVIYGNHFALVLP